MRISITKKDGKYTLDLQSGHFSGKLEAISEDSIDELIESLKEVKESGNPTQVRVWNPRSQRHEIV